MNNWMPTPGFTLSSWKWQCKQLAGTVQVPDGWLEVIRGPQPKSEQWPRRQSVTHQTDRPGRREERQHPPQGPFQDAPRSLSGAVGCPRQGSRYQVGGGNVRCWRVGPDIPCITRRSEPCTCPSGVAPSRGLHHRHRNFLAEGKEKGRERSPGSEEGPSRVVFYKGQIA